MLHCFSGIKSLTVACSTLGVFDVVLAEFGRSSKQSDGQGRHQGGGLHLRSAVQPRHLLEDQPLGRQRADEVFEVSVLAEGGRRVQHCARVEVHAVHFARDKKKPVLLTMITG